MVERAWSTLSALIWDTILHSIASSSPGATDRTTAAAAKGKYQFVTYLHHTIIHTHIQLNKSKLIDLDLQLWWLARTLIFVYVDSDLWIDLPRQWPAPLSLSVSTSEPFVLFRWQIGMTKFLAYNCMAHFLKKRLQIRQNLESSISERVFLRPDSLMNIINEKTHPLKKISLSHDWTRDLKIPSFIYHYWVWIWTWDPNVNCKWSIWKEIGLYFNIFIDWGCLNLAVCRFTSLIGVVFSFKNICVWYVSANLT